MENLLEKCRTFDRLLQEDSDHPAAYGEMAEVLGTLARANVSIVGAKGRILGCFYMDGFVCEPYANHDSGEGAIAEADNEVLSAVSQTQVNIHSENGKCLLGGFCESCDFAGIATCIVPMVAGGRRQGTLVLTKNNKSEFGMDDTILAEHCAMLICMTIRRERSVRVEEEARRKTAVQVAIGTLSYSEREAIECIFAELNGMEALLVASKIADREGITRSVIVNALRKLESAGVISTKSLGMKGTFIRILNDSLPEELAKSRNER